MNSDSFERGYILTIDALIALAILLAFLYSMNINPSEPSLNNEVAFQQAQDIVESCIRISKPEGECFQKIERVNPNLELNKGGGITIKRKIDGELRSIRFKLRS